MSAAKEQVATRLLPADRARVLAIVPGLPEALRGRETPTEADALRVCILRGLAWVEAHGYDAEVPAGRIVVKRAPLAKGRGR